MPSLRPRQRLYRVALYAGVLCALYLTFASSGLPSAFQGNCSDSIKDCKLPVKFVTAINGCYVFACEYGTPKARLVKVSDKRDKATLDKLAAETERASPGKAASPPR